MGFYDFDEDDFEDGFEGDYTPTPPLGLYNDGADYATEITDFFTRAGLPLPNHKEYYRTFEGGRLILLTPFACTIRVTPEDHSWKENHPHALKPLFSCSAGRYQIDINPGIESVKESFKATELADVLEKTGLKINDASWENFGIIPGSSPRFPVVLDLDSWWVKVNKEAAGPLNANCAEVKALLKRGFSLADSEAATTPQDIYNPLRELAKKAWLTDNKQTDTSAMKQFWQLCVSMKRAGQMVSPWEKEENAYGSKNRITTTEAARNYSQTLQTLNWA